jgi:hypothetical protein
MVTGHFVTFTFGLRYLVLVVLRNLHQFVPRERSKLRSTCTLVRVSYLLVWFTSSTLQASRFRRRHASSDFLSTDHVSLR